MINPDRKVKYTSQIIDGGDKPQFVVTAADEPLNPIISHSPSACWSLVLTRVMNASGVQDTNNVSVSGTLRFGLAHPVISHLIRELPNADKCEQITSLSLLSSPERRRKRAFADFSDSSSEEGEQFFNTNTKKPKATSATTMTQSCAQYYYYYENCFSARDVVLTSREEIDDLESAVATLQALKHCAIY